MSQRTDSKRERDMQRYYASRPRCSRPGCDDPEYRGSGLCLPHRDEDRPSVCGYCDEPFVSRRARNGWTQTCSKSCAQRLLLRQGGHAWQRSPRYGIWTDGGDPERDYLRGQRSRRARRARKQKVKTEPYTTAEIAERDGWRCGICRRKVRADLEWPHPRSASVDHIIPLSRGGDDVRTNCRLSHLQCNISLGNTMEWGQQLLIG